MIEIQGSEILHGVYPVSLALQHRKREIYQLFYNPNSSRVLDIVNLARENNIPTHATSRRQLDHLSNQSEKHSVHQGICADVSKLFFTPLDPNEDQVSS